MRRNRMQLRVVGTAILIGAIAAPFFARIRQGDEMKIPFVQSKPRLVGTDVPLEQTTEFYWTYATSTFPPTYQRYHFYSDANGWLFYHERREGERFPLTEEDVVASGTLRLSDKDRANLFAALTDGTVRAREDAPTSGGSGPWTYLYWTGDRTVYQAFEFASRDRADAFQALCNALTEREVEDGRGVASGEQGE